MDYIKIVRTGTFSSNVGYFSGAMSFDTHGLAVKLKVISGSLKICARIADNDKYGYYELGEGETAELFGSFVYYGTAEVQYMLLDKV